MSNERDALLKLVDLALTVSTASARIHDMIDRARAEDRTITMEEVDALSEETAKRRARWDSATSKS